MQRIDRRDFLKIGAGAAVVLGASSLLGGCGDSGESVSSVPTSPPLTRVAIVKGGDLRAMARDALDAVGGIGSVVGEGQTVFIKPNFVTIGWQSAGREAIATGECTKPEILMAVAEECLKVGASEVIIGDGAQMPTWSWDKIMTLDRSTNMAAEAQRLTSAYEGKVTLACVDADSPEWVDVPTRTSLEKISVSSLVARADRVISIPVLKTHQWAQMTLSMKCFIGTTPLAKYGAKLDGSQPRVVLHGTDASIEQVFLDIVKGVTPDLAIIDASIGVEGDGPALGTDGTGGKTIDVKERIGGWLLLASKDVAAADATAARLTGHDVSKIRQLNMALEQGVGEIREEKIEIVGERLEDVRMEWIAATPATPADLIAGPYYHRHVAAV
ncbi:MAG: DUF362 domain-containing protein [Acidobacteria bacterium]|nr:DUF362 domain-containing protein [Acidobacteriota bacterium]